MYRFIFALCCCVICSAMTPQEAMQRLSLGNQRYTQNRSEHPNRDEERRQAISSTQAPYAVIVGCADSRVAPEIIFDEGLGDLFVVRVAGNVIGDLELESIKYAVFHLKSVIIVVLGHERCGAVDAVVQDHTEGISEIARLIQPAVRIARTLKPRDLLKKSIQINAQNMKSQLEHEPGISELIQKNQIQVKAAYYNLSTGRVTYL